LPLKDNNGKNIKSKRIPITNYFVSDSVKKLPSFEGSNSFLRIAYYAFEDYFYYSLKRASFAPAFDFIA